MEPTRLTQGHMGNAAVNVHVKCRLLCVQHYVTKHLMRPVNLHPFVDMMPMQSDCRAQDQATHPVLAQAGKIFLQIIVGLCQAGKKNTHILHCTVFSVTRQK
jgi:hypothetical protein